MMMDLKREGSAYRAYRTCAYRNKYETALIFGGKSFTYGELLSGAEQAYNTFRQMGIEPRERVCLWLPNCPDLLRIFYGLSRMGAIGVFAHPDAAPAEVIKQMEATGAARLITTAQNYEAFCSYAGPLGAGKISICRPEREMKGKVLRLYRQKNPASEDLFELDFLDQQMEKNRYHAGDAAYLDPSQPAAILFGSSSFLQVKPVEYLPAELYEKSQLFYGKNEAAKSVYIEHSFAFEGGFLAAHSALCSGKTILWGKEEAVALLKHNQPDLIVATEELFWLLRQRAGEFRGRWKNLQGGIQMGRAVSPLMRKYAPRALEKMGGKGCFSESAAELKIGKEPLCFMGDFGVRLADVAAAVSNFDGIEKCRCLPYQGGFILQIMPQKKGDQQLGAALIQRCRREMGPLHLPKKVEFIG
ncbi:MAG: AMP-binding protein [Clostridia bacterium]|nr:AMP-binding protein [Clostridia bacterium]